jgi:aspartyl-tRNA(Asn)/glutamyl-tRNA(Gln) amidotransferase subunit B
MINLIEDGTISGKIAKEVFEEMYKSSKKPADIVKEKGLTQITDEGAVVKAIEEAMAKNPTQLAEYRAGKEKLFAFFVGQVMKLTKGKANPQLVNDLLKKMLSGS